MGLTTDDPGSEPGEPDKYYPTGDRTYTRIVPKDTIQAAALVTLMKRDGCTKVAMTNDKEVYGAGLARVIELSAKEQGLELTGNDAIDKNASNYRSIASKAKAAGADCFVYSGITANNAVQQFKDFAAALGSEAKLYGPDGVCETGFVSEKDGGIPAVAEPAGQVTVATLTPDQYPPEGQEFFKDFTEKYGVDNPDPYAIYGYEAMSLALDAIERSGDGSRRPIKKALFATKDRSSVLGTYSIDENGDTTLTDYGAYGVKNGELKFDQVDQGAGGLSAQRGHRPPPHIGVCSAGSGLDPLPAGRLSGSGRTSTQKHIYGSRQHPRRPACLPAHSRADRHVRAHDRSAS